MKFDSLSFVEEKGILNIKLNRPEKRNAINQQMLMDLERCFIEVATDDSVTVVILSGAGGAFSAGTDLNALGELANSDSQGIRRFIRKAQKALSAMENLEKGVIALIHGYAMGAGFELMLACDLRIASKETVFTIPEVNLGIVPDLGGSQRLPRIVGLPKAKELILTGKTISALEAEQIGLVNKVVPLDQLEQTGKAWAQEIMNNDPAAVGLAKRNIDLSFNQSLADGLESAGIFQSLLITSDSFKQRVDSRLARLNQGKKNKQ